VARAIFGSTIPVISAVGHEIDFTIADFVADIRAATPTGAAELAVPHFAELLRHVDGLQQRMIGALSTRLRDMQSRVERIQQSSVFAKPTQRIQQLRQQIDHTENELELLLTKSVGIRQKQVHELNRRLTAKSPVERLIRMEQRFGYSLQKLQSAMDVRLDSAANRFHRTIDKLDAYSPLQVMKRGYSLTYRDGKGAHLVRSIRQLQLGDRVHVRVPDGWLDCQVWGMEEEAEHAEQKASGKQSADK
jgi:exodeoxyribonuclease VII large subunit